jgi:hypothetical protein
MATRNLTMIVDREHAENSTLGFAANPSSYADKSYVNMYLHHDGYPEWQGVQIANWVHANGRQDGSAMAAKLVHDMYYDSCYLYQSPESIDHQYTYIIWTGKKDIWISCYNQYSSECVFVLKPEKIISKYMEDMDYTDFANGETRYHENIESNKVNLSLDNATKVIDILKNSIQN